MTGLDRAERDTPMPDPGGTKSTVLARRPEDWPRLFVQYLNSGDLETVAALYAPNARFVARSGEMIIGRDGIRDMLTRMIQSKTKLQSQVIRAINADDVAYYTPTFRARRWIRRKRRSTCATTPSRFSAASLTPLGN